MNPVDAVANWSTRRSLRNMASMVKEPRRFAWLAVGDFVKLLVMAFVWAWLTDGDDRWWQAIIQLFFAGYIGLHMLNNVRRGMAYRTGWLDGRHALMGSMKEAHSRGMEADEWIEAELMRDLMVMGVDGPEAAAELHLLRRQIEESGED